MSQVGGKPLITAYQNFCHECPTFQFLFCFFHIVTPHLSYALTMLSVLGVFSYVSSSNLHKFSWRLPLFSVSFSIFRGATYDRWLSLPSSSFLLLNTVQCISACHFVSGKGFH